MIGIDGNEANVTQRVGSNTYAFQILKGLHEYDSKTDYQVYLKNSQLPDLPPPNDNWHYKVIGPKKFWTQLGLPLDLYFHRPKPKLFFSPGHYAPRFSPTPTVISILDLAFLHFPGSFKPIVLNQLKSWTHQSALKAAHIFTISKSSKHDIVNHYGINKDKITVTYPGSNLSQTPISPKQSKATLAKYKITKPYFIFVGTRQPRKNLPRLIDAFLQLKQSHKKPLQLVIVGKTWHQFADQSDSTHPDIVYTGYVPDKDLPSLLHGSLALAFPSLYEGFGLPVLEAMKSGVLVAASNTSSIPELTGKSPLLFDPESADDITSKLSIILKMSSQNKQKLIKTAKIRARQFTWEKCSKQTIDVLHKLSSESSSQPD